MVLICVLGNPFFIECVKMVKQNIRCHCENLKKLMTPLYHRPKQGANFAWGQQSGAWGRAGNANLLGVKETLLGVCLG